MTERRFPDDTRDELERSLGELGRHVAWPVVPGLSASVRTEIERSGAGRGPVLPVSTRTAIWLAAAVLVLLLGALAIVPEMRTAIADRLGLRGVEIRWLDDAAPAPASPTGADLDLGRTTTLDAARQQTGFPVLIPSTDRLPAPGAVYIDHLGGVAMVSIVYPSGETLPPIEVAGVGALLTQFPGETDRSWIMKGLGGSREQGETILESITVNGGPGFWIAGAPHGVYLACSESGDCREERYRLAGNVLLWEQDGLTLRFESALSRDEALAIAASVRTSD